MNDLAVVLVHYRTPQLVRPAIDALAAELDGAGLTAEILLVDNGSEAGDRAAWSDLPLRHLDGGENRGYAAGVVLGVEASSAPLVVAMNPDVEVRPGCLGALVGALESGADAAGPEFFWNRAATIKLPPTEPRTRSAEIVAALGRRFAWAASRARRRWRRHARRHWLAESALATSCLSGALLAFRRDAWRRVGPFDSGFRLYFEESDWLLRLAASGGRAVYVPEATAFHWYAQSSLRQPEASTWFAESERRFRQRSYGSLTTSLLESLAANRARAARREPSHDSPVFTEPPAIELSPARPGAAPGWIEISPLACGFPAAAEKLTAPSRSWAFPADLWQRLAPGELWIRTLDESGLEISARRVVKHSSDAAGAD